MGQVITYQCEVLRSLIMNRICFADFRCEVHPSDKYIKLRFIVTERFLMKSLGALFKILSEVVWLAP